MQSRNLARFDKFIETNKLQGKFVQERVTKEVERNQLAHAFPASIGRAKLHRQASKFAYRRDLKGEIPSVCACCRQRVDGQPVPLCYGPGQESIQLNTNYEEFKLCTGIASLFSFFKAIVILILLLALANIPSMIAASCQLSQYLPKVFKPCLDTSEESDKLPIYFFLGSLLIAVVFFIIARKKKNEWYNSIASRKPSEDNYTVLISGIPILDFPKKGEADNDFFYRRHLEQFLEEKVLAWASNRQGWDMSYENNQRDFSDILAHNGGQLKSTDIVKSITLCYNLSRLQIIDETRWRLAGMNVEEEQGTQLIDTDHFSTLPMKVQFLDRCRIALNKQFAVDNSFLFNLTHFVGNAFVTFQYSHYRNYLLQLYKSDSRSLLYNGSYLKVAPANHPAHVHWKNLRYSTLQKKKMQISTYLILALILIAQFVLLFALHYLLYNSEPIFEWTFTSSPFVFLLVASLIIVLTNLLIAYKTHSMVKQEKHKMMRNQAKSYIAACTIAMFIGSTIQPFFINLLLGKAQQLPIYANIIITVTSALEIFLQLVHPSWMKKQVLRLWRYRNWQQNQGVHKFQDHLNTQFELPQYHISQRYSYTLYKLYTALFFAHPSPLALAVTFISLTLSYCLQKLNLYRRSSLFYSGDLQLSNFAMRFAQGSLLVYAAAYCYFESESHHKLDIISAAGTLFALLYILFMLLAPASLQRLIFGRETTPLKYIYDDCVAQGYFDQTYWSTNPATFLVDQQSLTGKEAVTNPSLLRNYVTGQN